MEALGVIGFVFGLIAFTTVTTANKKIKALEQRIKDLENK